MSGWRSTNSLFGEVGRKRLIDLHRRAKRGGAKLVEARGDRPRNGVKAFCGGRFFAERSDRLAGVAADADAGIDFDFAQDRNTVRTGGPCAFTVTEDVHRLSAVGT